MESQISTITWFDGNPQYASRIIRNRVKKILARNPWLGGVLERENNGFSSPVHLVFEEGCHSSEVDIDRIFEFYSLFDIHLKGKELIHLGMELQKMVQIATENSFVVKSASSLILGQEKQFSRYLSYLIVKRVRVGLL